MITEYENQKILIEAVAENIFRVRRDLSGNFQDVSLVVKNLGSYDKEEEGNGQLKTESFSLEVTDGAVQVKNKDGKVVYSESGCTISPTDLKPDLKTVPTELQDKIHNELFSYELTFNFTDDEIIGGLGNHSFDSINLRGRYVDLVQYNRHQPVPVFVSNCGYAVFVDEYAIQCFDDRNGKATWHIDASSCANYYIILGENQDAMVKGYRSLVGDTTLFPKSLFGYIQSKERYKSQKQLVGIAKKYRHLNVPLDIVVQDWRYWKDKKDNWGNKVFDGKRFPNPGAMTKELHDNDVDVAISIWPKLGEKASDVKDYTDENALLPGGYYNAYREECRDIYYKQLYNGIMKYDFDVLWTDDTEPLEPDCDLSYWPDGEDLVDLMRGAYEGFCDPRFSNAYVLLHNQSLYKHMNRDFPGKRKMLLTRGSYAGVNASGAVGWTGDILSSFNTLKKQIPSMLNHSLAGEAYDHYDIGGFFPLYIPKSEKGSGDYRITLKNSAFNEFYVRSLQIATFSPIMRSHGTTLPREIWRFGRKGGKFYDAIEKYIRIRYKLLPYIYSMSYQVSAEGKSMMYPLYTRFDDPKVKGENCNYMFGESLLVCPVLRHMYYSPVFGRFLRANTKMEIYLPLNSDWYRLGTTEKRCGGNTVTVDAPLNDMPVFVKAGSILPLNKNDVQSTKEKSPLEIWVYPGADCSFTYYDDDGETNNYKNGEFTLINFQYKEETNELTIDGNKPYTNSVKLFCKKMDTGHVEEVVFIGDRMTVKLK